MAPHQIIAKCGTFLFLSALALAHPDLYTRRFAPTCTSHPDRKYDRHAFAPMATNDPIISIALKDSTGNTLGPSSLVCPGAEYQLEVSFTRGSKALLTASFGTLSATSDKKCPNRKIELSAVAITSSALTLPCLNDMTGRKLDIKVTCATGETDRFHQALQSFGVDEKCGVGACFIPSLPEVATNTTSNSTSNSTQPSPCPALPLFNLTGGNMTNMFNLTGGNMTNMTGNITGCTQSNSTIITGNATVSVVNYTTYRALFDAGWVNKTTYIVDVRAPPLYKAGHIPGAVNIPIENFDKPETRNKTVLQLPTNMTLMFYCSLGVLSERAANEAVSTGLLPGDTVIYVLEGGFAKWKPEGPTVQGNSRLMNLRK